MKGVYPSTFLSERRLERGAGLWDKRGLSCPRQSETTEEGGEEVSEGVEMGGGGEESLSPSSLPHEGGTSGGSTPQ